MYDIRLSATFAVMLGIVGAFEPARAISSTFALVSVAAAPIDTLKIANEVATRLKDRTYGSQAKDATKIDCVEFVNEVAGECCKASEKSEEFTAELRKRIAIATLKPEEKLQELVEKQDDRIKGVQWALVQAGLGTAVPVAEAKAGDFVQYWYERDGKWAGHAGVIQSINSGSAVLLGSHRTTLASEKDKEAKDRNGGVGESTPIKLDDPRKKVFVVRWKY